MDVRPVAQQNAIQSPIATGFSQPLPIEIYRLPQQDLVLGRQSDSQLAIALNLQA
jgi:hypothetical protein